MAFLFCSLTYTHARIQPRAYTHTHIRKASMPCHYVHVCSVLVFAKRMQDSERIDVWMESEHVWLWYVSVSAIAYFFSFSPSLPLVLAQILWFSNVFW